VLALVALKSKQTGTNKINGTAKTNEEVATQISPCKTLRRNTQEQLGNTQELLGYGAFVALSEL
jgi:phage replication-related protein YjqB (UPF0714/DUF867 family)